MSNRIRQKLEVSKVKPLSLAVFMGILIGIGYFGVNVIVSKVLLMFLGLDFLSNEVRFQFFYALVYMCMLLPIIIYFLARERYSGTVKRTGLRSIWDGIPLFAAVLAAFSMDPITRFSEIFERSQIIIPDVHEPSGLLIGMLLINTLLLAPLIEETVFREYILRNFIAKGKLYWIGIFLSSFLFAIVHDSGPSRITAFAFGIISGIIYLSHGLIGAILFHVVSNIIWLGVSSIWMNEYWWIIESLDFGFWYWAIHGLSTLALVIMLSFAYPKKISAI